MRIRFFRPTAPRQEVGRGSKLGSVHPVLPTRACRSRPLVDSSTVLVEDLELGAEHAIFIRGNGGGLSWDRGLPLSSLGRGSWCWSAADAEQVQFQLLLDDLVWERGQPHTIEPGGVFQFRPDFEWPEIPKTCRRLSISTT